jgi:Fe-S cluster biogenesis protein NfuA
LDDKRPLDDKGKDQVTRLCREVLAPIVRADGGEMYLVAISADELHLHLSGRCAGCPGAALTRDKVLAPALRAASAKMRLVVTTGWKVPDGATKIEAA